MRLIHFSSSVHSISWTLWCGFSFCEIYLVMLKIVSIVFHMEWFLFKFNYVMKHKSWNFLWFPSKDNSHSKRTVFPNHRKSSLSKFLENLWNESGTDYFSQNSSTRHVSSERKNLSSNCNQNANWLFYLSSLSHYFLDPDLRHRILSKSFLNSLCWTDN